MKLSIFFSTVLALSALASVSSKTIELPTNLDFGQIAKMTEQELDQLAAGLAVEEIIRTKRSHSGDILSQATKKITSGIGQKIALLGQASAGASSFFSGAKGHHDEHGYSYDAPVAYHGQSFDFWTLKKSILNTLFQAVKAITGGVTILKGQLIKGGGALAQGLGKVIAVKGEAVTNLGRHIVNSAALVPPKKHAAIHVAPAHISVNPTHIIHTAPSAPSLPVSSYGPPTAPSPSVSYGPPSSQGYYDGGHYNLHSTSNSLYSIPTKYTLPLEAMILTSLKFDSRAGQAKYPSTGLQAGLFVLQPLDNSHLPSNHGIRSSGPGPVYSNSVSSAFQALKGILTPSSAPSYPGTGPSGVQDLPSTAAAAPFQYDPQFNPPPPIPSSYNTHNYPPFKPLNAGSKSHTNSYGTPLAYDSPALQSMADAILGMNDQGPSYDSYLQSFPDAQGSQSQKQTIIIKDGKGLGPLDLGKINDNIDKLNEARKRTEKISFISPHLFKRMGVALEVEPVSGDEVLSESKEVPKKVRSQKTYTHVDINKSITYELRGNRIVKLVDGIADV